MSTFSKIIKAIFATTPCHLHDGDWYCHCNGGCLHSVRQAKVHCNISYHLGNGIIVARVHLSSDKVSLIKA